jgi:hypothetical protein
MLQLLNNRLCTYTAITYRRAGIPTRRRNIHSTMLLVRRLKLVNFTKKVCRSKYTKLFPLILLLCSCWIKSHHHRAVVLCYSKK